MRKLTCFVVLMCVLLMAAGAMAAEDGLQEALVRWEEDAPGQVRQVSLAQRDSAAAALYAVGEDHVLLLLEQEEGADWTVRIENGLVAMHTADGPALPEVSFLTIEEQLQLSLAYQWADRKEIYAFAKEEGEWVLHGADLLSERDENVGLYRRDRKVRLDNCCGGVNAPAFAGEALAVFDAFGATTIYRQPSQSTMCLLKWKDSLPSGVTVQSIPLAGMDVRMGPGEAYPQVGGAPAGDIAAVYGQTDGWWLVYYVAHGGGRVFGYAQAELPMEQALALSDVPITIAAETEIYSAPGADSPSWIAGEEMEARFLALYAGRYAYVEMTAEGKPVRVFVDAFSIERIEE